MPEVTPPIRYTIRQRALPAATSLLLVGCSAIGQAAPLVRPVPSATPLSTPGVPATPFAPKSPTQTPPSNNVAAPTPGDWPEPNTFGRAATPAVPIPPPAAALTFPEGTLNLLLLGSDRRSGIGFRTDTIVIASIQPARGLVSLVSVPRDLYVYLPGYTISRINTAWIYGETIGYPGGGPQLLFDTVRYNLGVPIDRYALVEMQGFQQIVDLLGGLDVPVACDFTDWRLRRPDLPQEAVSSWALFTVPRGVVHMDGEFALWYARSRARSSDFDRARRQQEVLRATYRRGLRPGVLAGLPDLYRALQSAVKSDISLDDALSLAPFATRLEPAHIRSRFIGKKQVTSYRVPVSGAAVLLPQADAIHALLQEAFAPYDESESAPVRVEVVSAGDPALAQLAQERLLYAGFDAIVTDGDPSPDGTSHLMDKGIEPENTRARVVQALGLPATAVVAWPEGESTAPFRLILGGDYNPCFDPSALAPG